MKRRPKRATPDDISIEDRANAIRGLSTVLRLATLGILAEEKAGGLPTHLHSQIDLGVSDIANQIDAHARAIVDLDLGR